MDLEFDGLSADSLLDARKLNDGVWIHLDSLKVDPDTGKRLPMYLAGDPSKPQRALVRSYRSDVMKAAEKKRQKEGFVKMRVAKKGDRDEVIAESSVMPDEDRFACLLVALENFSKAGGVQMVAPEAARAMCARQDVSDIVTQIREAGYSDDNYLAGSDTEVGNVAPPTATSAAPVSAN